MKRTVVGTRKLSGNARIKGGAGQTVEAAEGNYATNELRESVDLTVATSPQAIEWDGHGHALRPSQEPCILARKPLAGSIAENVLMWGVGPLNIPETRIPRDWTERGEAWARSGVSAKPDALKIAHPAGQGMNLHADGGWPANVIIDEAMADELGDFARYFYCAKVSKRERDEGCLHLPLRSAAECTDRKEGSAGSNRPQAGAGRGSGAHNPHPNVKPLALLRYLARLAKPINPNAILLCPYSGSGSEIIGALQAGWPAVVGIEREAEYVTIADARIPAWVDGARRVA